MYLVLHVNTTENGMHFRTGSISEEMKYRIP